MIRIIKYVMFMIIALGAGAGLWTVHADSENQDLERLLRLSEQIMVSSDKVIMKHTGTYRTFADKAEFEKLGHELSRKLIIPAGTPETTKEQDHLLFKATGTGLNGMEQSVLLIGFSDGTSELIAAAAADGWGGHQTESILTVQQEWTGKLEAMGIKPHWNLMIQGNAAPAVHTEPESWLQAALSKQLQAQTVGRYEDNGSLSISYYSPQIRETVSIGENKKMNLQVAVHRNSNTHQQRVTIGMPAISIEY